MSYRPGDSYFKEFVTSSAAGAAVNADSLPVATANHNGTDDGSFTLTVTNIDAGRYKITGTVPSGYTGGNVVGVSVAATIGGIATKAIVDTFVLDRVLTEGTINIEQATALILDVLLSIRSGVPASGSPGTVTVKDPTGVNTRAVIVLDSSGDITGITLTPPTV